LRLNHQRKKEDALVEQLDLGRYDDAIAVYGEILEIYPDEIRALSGKGDALKIREVR